MHFCLMKMLEMWLKFHFAPKGPFNNIQSFVQVMAWHQPGSKPLSEQMMVRLPMHKCVTWPQKINILYLGTNKM